MPTRLETLERLLLYKLAIKGGDAKELDKLLDEVLDEARSQRQRKAKDDTEEKDE